MKRGLHPMMKVRDENGNATSMGDKSISNGNSQHTQSMLVFSDQNGVGSNITSNIPTENNEGVEPADNYFDALKDRNWVKAMNAKIEALNKVNTWTITDLPEVQNEWPLFQLDVNNPFLYGDLYEDVYMSLPLGCNGNNDNKVCKLKKLLYGIKQAPIQWNDKLVSALVDHGFVQSKYNDSLFVKDSGNTFMALLVYVDDIVRHSYYWKLC
ncbi:ribonuclease H-like domain-containing protein [Tanacetum coccineum]|uniref:Ribonuclease H-like domain-containing protein n=1 Tax=Tanacetum coccineum TaxID=301880 RepID=A0ABQ4ZA37_9ASTR